MKFEEYPLHDSQRGWFGRELYFTMQADPRIILFTADLGFVLFDKIRNDFPDRFVNAGASEQSALGAAVGATYCGKIPIVFSITTFLLFRSFEWLRNYLQHEGAPVILVGSGLNDDYKHDGITHQSHDAKKVLALFPRIKTYFPSEKCEIPSMLRVAIASDLPSFICLRR